MPNGSYTVFTFNVGGLLADRQVAYLLRHDHKGAIRHKWVGKPGEKSVDAALQELLAEAEVVPGRNDRADERTSSAEVVSYH